MDQEKIEISAESEEERHARHKRQQERRREQKRRKATVVAFFMSVAMTLNVFAVGLYMGFFSTNASKRLSGYIDEYLDDAYTIVLQRVEALSIKNGLPSNVYEEILTKDRMKITVESFVNDLSDPDFDLKVVTDDISEALLENVRDYLRSTNVKIDENVSKNVSSYVTQCINIYRNTLIFSHFRTMRQLKIYLFYAAVAVTIVCVTFIAICLILINRYVSKKRQMLRYLIYSVGTTWVLTLAPSFLIANRLVPIYLKGMILECQFKLIMNYFYNSFHYMISVSWLIFVIYLILLGAWYYMAVNKRSHF